jgi:tryptophan-rich sensory protein
MWAASLATGLGFYSVNQTAGLLFIPYQVWLTLAATLNYVIWRDNGDQPSASSAD